MGFLGRAFASVLALCVFPAPRQASASVHRYCAQAMAEYVATHSSNALALLQRVASAPTDATAALIYADALDDVGTARAQHQAEAIRLAVAIENEGGDGNPFAPTVATPALQRERLRRDPRGATLLGRWIRSGWSIPPGLASEFGILFRAGLPRAILVAPGWEFRTGPLTTSRLLATMPTVSLVADDPNFFVEYREMIAAALQGHPGALATIVRELKTPPERPANRHVLRTAVRELLDLAQNRGRGTAAGGPAHFPAELLEALTEASDPPLREAFRRSLQWRD